MPPFKHPVKAVVFTAVLLVGGQAQAAAITNLSGKAQTVGLQTAEGFQPVVIEANATWRMLTPVKVQFGNRETLIGAVEEYVIWNDTTFGPQRPNARAGSSY